MMLRGRLSGVPGGPSSWQTWLAGVAVAACLALALLSPAQAKVQAMLDGNSSPVDFVDGPAWFGVPLSLRGHLPEARPAGVCQFTEGKGPRPGNYCLLDATALSRRYNCTFDLEAPCSAGSAPEALRWRRTGAPSLRLVLRCARRVRVVLPPPEARARPAWLLPPAAAAAGSLGLGLGLAAASLLLLLLLLLLPVGRWARGRWRRAPSVKTQTRPKAQVRVYTRHSDLCAICLEQYEEGDELKILPCAHAFHRGCVDPWLAQAPRRACPMCKRPVASSEDGSDSAAESPGEDGPGAPAWPVGERLRPRAPRLLARVAL